VGITKPTAYAVIVQFVHLQRALRGLFINSISRKDVLYISYFVLAIVQTFAIIGSSYDVWVVGLVRDHVKFVYIILL